MTSTDPDLMARAERAAKPLGVYSAERLDEFLDALVERGEVIDVLLAKVAALEGENARLLRDGLAMQSRAEEAEHALGKYMRKAESKIDAARHEAEAAEARASALEAELRRAVPADVHNPHVTPGKWNLIVGEEHGEMGTLLQRYCEGIRAEDGRWVVRFDDDYGTNQWADAALIVELHNAAKAATDTAGGMPFDEFKAGVEQISRDVQAAVSRAHEGATDPGVGETPC